MNPDLLSSDQIATIAARHDGRKLRSAHHQITTLGEYAAAFGEAQADVASLLAHIAALHVEYMPGILTTEDIAALRVRAEALYRIVNDLLEWKQKQGDPARQELLDGLMKIEPCGYYCDESVGHVDHQLFNAAKFLFSDGTEPDVFERARVALEVAQGETK